MAYKVIIADDEPIMRKAMQSLMDWEQLGCQLTYVASTGIEVMNQLEKDTPDILILDIKMPGVSGLDIAKYVWEKKLPVKVILLTAYADFSFAQSAIKYDVVDYVIKTGAFEGLVVAIEKAKALLRDMQMKFPVGNQDVLKENFFKAIFDGTLFTENEIMARAEKSGIHIRKGWQIVAIRFRMNEDKYREYSYQSLTNFLSMVFESRIVHITATRKDMMVVVLSVDDEFRDGLSVQCQQVVEMMEDFMKMNVYVGISSRSEEIFGLKNIFDEAEYAVEEGFFYQANKINFYHGIQSEEKESVELVDRYMRELQFLMKKGKVGESLDLFQKAIDELMDKGCSRNIIIDAGIEVQSLCKKILAEYDKMLHDILPYERNISQRIYQCKHISGYMELMNSIIRNTVEYVNVAVSKKNILIYEAEKFIDENFEKGITVSEVTKSIGVSLSYLSRIFREETGNTLINYINQKKIEKAKVYLRSTDMKIYEIASALGFENTTYFSYFFKKSTGMSPKEYKDSDDE